MFRTRLPLVASLIFATLIASFLPANSASIAGTKCTKLNATKTVSNVKFTCTKSGKNLIWNKGVKIPKKPGTSANAESLNSKTEPITGNSDNSTINTDSSTSTTNSSSSSTNSSTTGTSPTSSKNIEPLLEKPCAKAGEEKTASFLLVCFKDRTRGLIWIRKGTDILYKFEGLPTSLINDSDIWTAKTVSTTTPSKNPLITIPALNGPQVGPTEVKQCKLKDVHNPNGPGSGPMAHGFPVTPMNPKYVTNGVMKVGILAVDFTDAPGESTLKADLDRNIAQMEDWFKYFSNGKLKLELTVSTDWVHSNKKSSEFDWVTVYPNTKWMDTAPKVAQSFVDLAPSNFDFSQLGALLVYFPQKSNKFNTDLTLQSLEYNTKQGRQWIAVEVPPNNLFERGQVPWIWWVHELLHGIGIAGHAPNGEDGLPLGIMINQYGGSLAMTAWDQFILEWLPDNQVYCLAPDKVAGQIVSLSPMEREDSITKAVVIPLSDSTGLVIQANRDDKWASKQYRYTFPDKFTGVSVYLVNTANGNFRSRSSAYGVDIPEFAGIIPENIDPQNLFFANYVKIDGDPRRTFACPAGLITKPGEENSVGGGCWQWNVLTYVVAGVGDVFTISGIKIEVVGSLENETIRITKAS